jgi:hypothetical protein
MSLFSTIHLHNVPAGRETAYADWFDGPHRDSLRGLRGFMKAERYEVAEAQVMPDIPQPWRFLSVYDVNVADPKIDLPALAPLLAVARDSKLIDDSVESERIHSYGMYSDWIFGANHQKGQPFSGVFIILANFVAGMEREYHKWYDEVHIPEVTAVPGNVAMRRGHLASVQIEPVRHCPGGELVMCAQQTDDVLFTVNDFSARARGVSESRIAMAPRSKAGSFARTVHWFRKISGQESWKGGIAYAGDLSAYPSRARAQ